MTNTMQPLKVTAPLDSVDWTKLPVGTKFRYWSDRYRKVSEREFIVRGARENIGETALWTSRQNARSRGAYLHKDGRLHNNIRHIGHILPHTIRLPRNTAKMINAGLNLAWLPSGTLVCNGLGNQEVIVESVNNVAALPITTTRFDPDATMFLGVHRYSMTMMFCNPSRANRRKHDLRSETAILPMMGWSGPDAWTWSDGVLTKAAGGTTIISADTEKFLSWEAAL